MRTPLVTAAAVACLLLTGCDSPDPAAVPTSSATPTPAPVVKSRDRTPVPIPGWASEVVRAGRGAYVVGWRADDSGALWRLGADGRLSPRAAPPGTAGNPGSTSVERVFDLAPGGPRLGLALTGRVGDAGQPVAEAVYATADGARHWRRVRMPKAQQPLRIAAGGGAAYDLTGVCARHRFICRRVTVWSVDEATGSVRAVHRLAARPGDVAETSLAAWAGTVWLRLGLGGPHPIALRSTDHGRRWHRFDAGLCLTQHLVPTSSRVLWSTCTTGMLAHFTRQTPTTSPRTVFNGDQGATGSASLQPLSDTTAYAVIVDRHGTHLERTRDGGVTTRTISVFSRRLARQQIRLVMVAGRVGYLLMPRGRIERTRDAGRHWTDVAPPPGASSPPSWSESP